jgi:hypothetical protein
MVSERRRSHGRRPGWVAARLTCIAALSVACAEKGAVARYARVACRLAPDSTVVFNGVKDFITDAEPFPQRFLYVPGTDSSLPDPGVLALQDKGPTYMYAASGSQQAVVRSKLSSIGDFASLLVAYHGFKRTDDTHAVIRLSGVYVTGKADGKTIPPTDFQMHCDSAGWHGPPKPAGQSAAASTQPGASH